MANAQLSLVLRHIRKLAGDGKATDRQLLHRFATQHEEAAVLATSWFALVEAQSVKLDADKIGTAARTKATTTSDGVIRTGWARTDVAGLLLVPCQPPVSP